MSIEELRNEIDSIDTELLQLFAKRMTVAKEIAEYKKKNSLPVFNSEREKEILEKLSASSPEEIREYIIRLYEKIFELSRSYQESIIEKTGDK